MMGPIDIIRSWFCKHEFEELCKVNVFEADIRGKYPDGPSYTEYTYICKKCGKQRKYKSN